MNKLLTKIPRPAESAVDHDHSAMKITEEEYRKLLATGHASGNSVAQSSVVNTMKRINADRANG